MSNDYYSGAFSATTGKARASQVEAIDQAVESAFDKLPTPRSTGDGFTEAVHVGAPTESGHAARLADIGTGTTTGTSASSVSIGTGSKSFTIVESNRGWGVGTFLGIYSAANTANFMQGSVTAYSGSSLTVNVTKTGGSGSAADWTIGLAVQQTTPVAVADGGTGSATASAARTALGAANASTFGAGVQNLELAFSVASSALTCAVKTWAGTDPSATDSIKVPMRPATASSNAMALRSITSALSLVVSNGSTLGRSLASTKGYLFWYLIDYNSGTLELAVSGKFYGAHGIVSTTAEGGGGTADSSVTMYSTTARSSVPFVCIAMTIDTQATAGAWGAVPSDVRPAPFTIPECAFRAYRTTDQTGVADITFTKYLATAEQMDISGDYDATNSRFVAPMPGVYTFHGAIHPKNAITGMEVIALLYLNGVTQVAQGYLKMESAGNAETAHVHATLFLNTHDYIELWLRHSRGTTEDFWGNISLIPFSGVRVGTGAA